MYIAAIKAKFLKLDQKNPAMKIQVWEKQYPSDKIFLRWYGIVTKENNQEYDETDTDSQRYFSDDIKVRFNFKVNHSKCFCEETYQSFKRVVYIESEPRIPYFPQYLVEHRIWLWGLALLSSLCC